MADDSNILLQTTISKGANGKSFESKVPLVLYKDHLEIKGVYSTGSEIMFGQKPLNLALSEVANISSNRDWNQFFLGDLMLIKTKDDKIYKISGVSHKDGQKIVSLVNQYKNS